MFNLPLSIIEFLKWWLLKAAKRIYVTSQRFVAIVNNELSFTLNIRLLFTPVFGDYSKAGRLIGFLFRVASVILGTVVISILWIISLITPIVWWVLPFAGFYFLKLWIIPIIMPGFVLWLIANKNTPLNRAAKTKENNLLSSFRPKVKQNYDKIIKEGVKFLPELMKDPQISFLLIRAELQNEQVCSKDGESTFCKVTKNFEEKLYQTPSIDTKDIIKTAHQYALKDNARYVEMEHLFLAVLSNIPKIDTLLATYNSSMELVEKTSTWVVGEREDLSRLFFWQEDYIMPTLGGIGKGMTGRVTPLLDSVSEDFTKQAQKGLIKNIVGRSAEIKKIAEILSGSSTNVLIIGEPGSGKTSIVKGIAYKIVKGVEYPALKYKRIVSLDVGTLIAGAKSAGDISQKIKLIMDEVKNSGDIILFIDEIHTLVAGTSSEDDTSNIFSLLETHLKGNIQFIGATNIQNYRKYIEPNGSFARLFELIEIPQASKEDTMEILKYRTKYYERDYRITITYPALRKVIDLSEKLIHERVLPDKALDILNRTASSKANTNKYLTSEDISVEISNVTHIPVSTIDENESKKLLGIEEQLKKHVIGQDNAITQVGAALKRARVGMRNEKKPIASFLFVGTTGVGKTETAKALAREYFGDEKVMIRLDMSEYQQADSIGRLIGTPDRKSTGILTEAVRTKPFSLILLDEIEKAYSSILLTFLQVLDDGRLTDSTGRVIDFTNTIIIATSNAGTKEIQEIATRNGTFEEMKEKATAAIREKFAPEFLNRFNGIIVFRPLDMDSVYKIAEIMLESVRKMAENKGIKVVFEPELISELVKRGFSPEWGARPLARVIEDSVESFLAVKILAGEIKQGNTLSIGTEIFQDTSATN